MTYYYRLAILPQDAERIHQLNYQAFVEEIPQHQPNDSGLLVDSFHEENTYILCVKDSEIVGMIALRSARPFSLDKKVGRIEDLLDRTPVYPVEIRLLVVDPAHRRSRAFFGLMQALVNWCMKAGHDAAVISGTTRQQKLYGQIGFQPFAEPVGTEEAKYVPLVIWLADYEQSTAKRLSVPLVNFLPGPLKIAENVQAALAREPFSHRSPVYTRLLASVQEQLIELTGANYVKVLQGTGTLANDAVAAQLSKVAGRGIVLVNGEFGQRLCDHAKRFDLTFDRLECTFGEPFSVDQLAERLDAQKYNWLWFVHCETSTGVLNDLGHITSLCRERGIYVAADCASSVGCVAVDLQDVDIASFVSGKGIASFAGLSIVVHKKPVATDHSIPRYLDLGYYETCDGIPYTQSSPLLLALHQALENLLRNPDHVYKRIQCCAEKLREGVEMLGMRVLSSPGYTNPGILTIVLPERECAQQLGDNLFLNGYRTHYESSYLQKRNWLQLAAMNQPTDTDIQKFLTVLSCLLVFNEDGQQSIVSGIEGRAQIRGGCSNVD